MKENIIVSIFMLTYNHEKYIAKALDSILKQKVNFPYEIVLGEDCSTDNTREIVLNYAKQYPDKFKLILHETNRGAMYNQNEVFANCTGKYIAICEGDDYWTDLNKLQKQVDFLEDNIDFSICFTDYIIFEENSKKFIFPELKKKYNRKTVFSRYNLILSNIIPTATVMFKNRKEVFSKLDPNLYPGDWFLHILNSEYGKIKFLPFESTVYRKHDGGVCSASNPIDNNMKYLKAIKIFRKVYSKKYSVQFLFNLLILKIRLQNIKFKLFK